MRGTEWGNKNRQRGRSFSDISCEPKHGEKPRHRLLLRPSIDGGILFVDIPSVSRTGARPAKHVHLAPAARTQNSSAVRENGAALTHIRLCMSVPAALGNASNQHQHDWRAPQLFFRRPLSLLTVCALALYSIARAEEEAYSIPAPRL